MNAPIGLDRELAAVIGQARAESERNTRRAEASYERGDHHRGHDLSEASKEEKRQLFRDAQNGRIGPEWQRLAVRRDVEIGVFVWFYEYWDRAPSDEELARMWPGPEGPQRRGRHGTRPDDADPYSDFDQGRF